MGKYRVSGKTRSGYRWATFNYIVEAKSLIEALKKVKKKETGIMRISASVVCD